MASSTTADAKIKPRSFLPGPVTIQAFHPGQRAIDWVEASFGPDGTANPARPTASSLASAFPDGKERDNVLWFHDAIKVRNIIFQGWQKAPWEDEVDGDDARSWHFNAYLPAEVLDPSGTTSTPPAARAATAAASTAEGPTGAAPTPAPTATAANPAGVCVGTLRLIPGPFGRHVAPGSQHYLPPGTTEIPEAELPEGVTVVPPEEWAASVPAGRRNRATRHHDGRELYCAVGRVATLEAARGRGVATRLIEAAVRWAQEHPEAMDRAVGEGEVDGEGNGLDGRGRLDDTDAVWNGLVLIHAIRDVVPLYRKCGFVVDDDLGVWIEAAMPHVAMWRRMEVAR